MLRFYTADLTHDITFVAGYEPPRPNLRPRERITADAGFAADPLCEDMLYDSGIRPRRQTRFVSSETQGLLSYAQVVQMIDLYEAGGPFLIDTDLLGAPGAAAVTYNAQWEPGTTPLFSLFTPDGALYYIDMLVRTKEV